MKLDDIAPSNDTVLTPELVRLFAAAGCSPTECHACRRKIKVGMTFKLVPHGDPLTDEMCCDRCGPHQLKLRDRRREKAAAGPRFPMSGGYSRPSRKES